MKTTKFVLITTTTNDPQTAEKITLSLLEQKLAACVQTETVTSHYFWEGKLVTDEEIRLTLKTRRIHIESVMEQIVQMHNYDLPEILVTTIEEANIPYLQWLDGELA